MSLKLLSHVDQVAKYLRDEILRGRWDTWLPGSLALKKELGTSHNTVHLALKLIEKEGLIESQGAGKRRKIIATPDQTIRAMDVEILCYESWDVDEFWMMRLYSELVQIGYRPRFSRSSLKELGMDVERVAKYAKKIRTDAWIVVSASREVLEWFSRYEVPAFALFGRSPGLDIAGTGVRMSLAYPQLVRKLVSLGHRRIVLLAREERRKPEPGPVEQAFLNEMEAQGIQTGRYHMPDWEETNEGLERYVEEVLRVTPPTAIITNEPSIFLAMQHHLAKRGYVAPKTISLVCTSSDHVFKWFNPPISSLIWDSHQVVRDAIRWAKSVARGKPIKGIQIVDAKLNDGGTIGTAPMV